MSRSGNVLVKQSAEKNEGVFNPMIKLVYWAKELYRFSLPELKQHFGEDYKAFIQSNLLIKSENDPFYYCERMFMRSVANGNEDGALFYSSLTHAQLKQIVPKEFHKGSRNDLITLLVREKFTVFPAIKNITSEKINEIFTSFISFEKIASPFIETKYSPPFDMSHPSHFFGQGRYSYQTEEIYTDITKMHPKLFEEGFLHCIVSKNPLSCCVTFNPNVCLRIVSEVKSKLENQKSQLLEEIPETRVNPSDVEYHESRLECLRVLTFIIAALDNDELGVTQDYSLKVADVKAFWKNILGKPLTDNHFQAYYDIIELFLMAEDSNKFEKKGFQGKLKFLTTLSEGSIKLYKDLFNNLPKDRWIPFTHICKLIPCFDLLTIKSPIIGNVESLFNDENESSESNLNAYLIKRKLFKGDIDLEVEWKKNGKKAEKIIKSVRVLENPEHPDILTENPSAKVFLENNLTLTLAPDLSFEKLLALLAVFSPKGLNSLELDSHSIFRLTNRQLTYIKACKYIESLLDQPIPPAAKEFLKKGLPEKISIITLHPLHRIITLSSSNDLKKVLDAVGNDKLEVINETLILLNPWVSIGTLKNKFKKRKIKLEVKEVKEVKEVNHFY